MRQWLWRFLLLVNVASVLACVAAMVVYRDVWALPVVGVSLGVLAGLGCVWELRALSALSGTTLTVADRIAPGTVLSVSGGELMVVVSCTGSGPFTLGVRRQRQEAER